MFEKKDSYKLGVILKPHGISGEVVLKFDNDIKEKHFELESILIDIDGGLVPFLFETIQQQTNETIIAKFILINTVEEARELNAKTFYVTNDIAEKLGLTIDELYKDITGFKVVDKKRGEIGIVNDIIDYTNHSVLQAYQGKKEILIPFDPALVKEIDPSQKIVSVDLPDGLLEVND